MSDVRPEMLRIGEFAERLDVDPAQVRRWVRNGLITRDKDGLFDAAQLAGDFRKANRTTIAKGDRTPPTVRSKKSDTVRSRTPRDKASAEVSETPAQAAERIVKERGGVLPLSQALAMKESYHAYMKRLEYDLKVGAVVPIETVAAIYGKELATVRTRLLAIPSSVAPRLTRARTAPEMEAAVRELIYEALSELADDRFAAAASLNPSFPSPPGDDDEERLFSGPAKARDTAKAGASGKPSTRRKRDG